MINGAHLVIYTRDADADRAFFRETLGFPSVDAGHGWLIFGLPTTEAAFHPAEANNAPDFYLMCDDLKSEIEHLRSRGVKFTEVVEARWGSVTRIRLPGGGEIGLYEPKHPRPPSSEKQSG